MPRYDAENRLHRLGIENVYCDGVEIERVRVADTDEGWVEYDTYKIVDDDVETETIHGVVRVEFKDADYQRLIEQEEVK